MIDKADQVMFLIRNINHTMRSKIDAQFKDLDLTFAQSHLLFRLNQEGGTLSQKKLQEELKVSHPTVVGLVQRMKRNGYVETSVDEKDKRQINVTLTEAAYDLQKEIHQMHIENDAKLAEGFSQEELDELIRLLNKMKENFKEEGNNEYNPDPC